MSDPVTQAEIEDVLSSIRRLVSEDGRVAPPARAAATPKSRLVLTPALRVAESRPEEAPAAAENLDAVSPLQDEAGIALDAQPELDPAEVLSFQNNRDVKDSPLPRQAPEIAAAAQADTPEAESPEVVAADAETAIPDDTVPWQEPGATLFGAVDAFAAPQETLHGADAPASPDAATQPLEVQLTPELDGSERVSAVVQKIAELEAKVAQAQDQWEPDGASKDPYAGTNIETLEWQDDIGASTGDAAETAPAPMADESAGQEPLDAVDLVQDAVTSETLDLLEQDAGDDRYLDEDSLREMVAEIVRSELQGALGERITRNVRKLVRREIQRALAAQDLI
ncbi:hypothetical protein [Pseudophaeobacter flagellatus]|uniref:hypothetical protein n=1 Tax=Pseudophaeobacter flagellatus TaxID=2899119 RepID=UPI001E641FF1|nr:hypothetical protein [Pseudophaeobacter flagellatus]MCD9149475.1 hypothetical protein [Pseudophaeobacter flagellatus]